MAILGDILDWSQTLPSWQQDAVRRLFLKTEGLSQQDYDELYNLLKLYHKVPVAKEDAPIPLARDHISLSTDNTAVVLRAIHDLEHVNCIAPSQSLEFLTAGITVIYGGNGSGKSGYARVLKRACRARDQKETILPNANDPNELNSIPKATFNIEIDGKPLEIQWQADHTQSEELASISVFDSHCARVYLTSEQELAYLPYGLDVVEALANKVIPELEQRLSNESAAINTDKTHLSHLQGETPVGRVIDNLSSQTEEEIRTLGTLSKTELDHFEQLEKVIKEPDPAEKVRQLKLLVGRLKEISGIINVASQKIDNIAIENLKNAHQEYQAAKQNEKDAATALKSDEVLLPGTGEAKWKAMFEAARRFSEEEAYRSKPFPNTEANAVCVLCQHPLDESDATRMNRFEDYIKNDVAKQASLKKEAWEQKINQFKKENLSCQLNPTMVSELNSIDEAILPQIKAFAESLEARRNFVCSIVDQDAQPAWGNIPILSANPSSLIRHNAATKLIEARAYQKACNESIQKDQEKEYNELSARKNLSLCLDKVLDLLVKIKLKKALNKCWDSLKTHPISLKAKALANRVITSDLKDALDAEFKKINISHIPTKLGTRTERGETFHRLILDIPMTSTVDSILSEGEQRAVSIASFLAELNLANHMGAIIFDDPVSSLDHQHQQYVARRLAEEAQKRQVVIFTHDLIFLYQLKEVCERLKIGLKQNFLERIAGYTGLIQDGLPWKHKSYKEKIDLLEKKQKEFEKMPWPSSPSEKLSIEMIQQYDFLRATIERVVQDFVLNGTIRRFEDYIRVDNLKKVVELQASEAESICNLYQRCHSIVGSHDSPSAKNNPPPTAEEFGQDISELKSIIQTIQDRRKQSGLT